MPVTAVTHAGWSWLRGESGSRIRTTAPRRRRPRRITGVAASASVSLACVSLQSCWPPRCDVGVVDRQESGLGRVSDQFVSGPGVRFGEHVELGEERVAAGAKLQLGDVDEGLQVG